MKKLVRLNNKINELDDLKKEELDYNKEVCLENNGIFAMSDSRTQGPNTFYQWICPFPGKCEFKKQEKMHDGRLDTAYCQLLYEKCSSVLGLSSNNKTKDL